MRARVARRSARHEDPEARAHPLARIQRDLVAEQLREAANDGETETHAAARRRVATLASNLEEFLEHALAIPGCNADTGVDDIDGHPVADATRADDHAA